MFGVIGMFLGVPVVASLKLFCLTSTCSFGLIKRTFLKKQSTMRTKNMGLDD